MGLSYTFNVFTLEAAIYSISLSAQVVVRKRTRTKTTSHRRTQDHSLVNLSEDLLMVLPCFSSCSLALILTTTGPCPTSSYLTFWTFCEAGQSVPVCKPRILLFGWKTDTGPHCARTRRQACLHSWSSFLQDVKGEWNLGALRRGTSSEVTRPGCTCLVHSASMKVGNTLQNRRTAVLIVSPTTITSFPSRSFWPRSAAGSGRSQQPRILIVFSFNFRVLFFALVSIRTQKNQSRGFMGYCIYSIQQPSDITDAQVLWT